MSIAEQIAERFDGRWIDDDGIDLSDVCAERAHPLDIERRETDGHYETRYAFADGSAIVMADDMWDVGFDRSKGCFCAAGADGKHQNGCKHA